MQIQVYNEIKKTYLIFDFNSNLFYFHFQEAQIACWLLNPSRPNPGRREKIELNFYFPTPLWCFERFYEGH